MSAPVTAADFDTGAPPAATEKDVDDDDDDDDDEEENEEPKDLAVCCAILSLLIFNCLRAGPPRITDLVFRETGER